MMKQTIKRKILKLFLIIVILFLFDLNAAAKFIANASERGFTASGSTGIRQYVIEAAGYFLKSQAEMLLFLNKIELEEINGIDYAELQRIIHNAVVYMGKAREKYNDLTQLAESTPYDQSTITALVNFNYTSFQGSKELNSVLFNEAKTYLSGGNVRGLYRHFRADTQSILDQLTVIKSDVDAEVIPETLNLWRVNKSYCEILLFGQYVAEVFYEVTGN
jgi:hypothetical protein